MSRAEYVSIIKGEIPDGAFRRRPGRVGIVLVHVGIVLGVLFLGSAVGRWWVCLCLAPLMGHSLACIAFLSHDLSHGTMLAGFVQRAAEVFCWGLNGMPATVWRRVHNETHHPAANSVADPDRVFRASEGSAPVERFNRVFMVNREGLKWRPTVLLMFTTYIARHVAAALGPHSWKPTLMPVKPKYQKGDRRRVTIELIVIAVLHLSALAALRWRPELYFSLVIPALLVSSGVVMMYIFTNHFLNSLHADADPLLGSTSVIVPKWMDWLHDNFSYHTEHHLFPSMSSKFYPQVAELLSKHFPERYNRLPLGEAWVRLWQREEFVREAE